jgi:hypothetical protein
VKLAGDTFMLNEHRRPDDRIYGILSVFTPEFYEMHPDAENWLSRYETAPPDPLATI